MDTRNRGFTLVELMIAVGILAILAAATAPVVGSAIRNAQIRTAVESINSGLQLARLEALRGNETFRFTVVAPDWSVSRVSNSAVISSGKLPSSASVSNVTVDFDGLGRVGSGVALNIGHPSIACGTTTDKVRCLRVALAVGGATRVCDPQMTGNDPRKC
jgi:type IV fimbrial biogenesis protein FimT